MGFNRQNNRLRAKINGNFVFGIRKHGRSNIFSSKLLEVTNSETIPFYSIDRGKVLAIILLSLRWCAL